MLGTRLAHPQPGSRAGNQSSSPNGVDSYIRGYIRGLFLLHLLITDEGEEGLVKLVSCCEVPGHQVDKWRSGTAAWQCSEPKKGLWRSYLSTDLLLLIA